MGSRAFSVARILMAEQSAYDAILLDVDNGPERFTCKDNDWLYNFDSLSVVYEALHLQGVLAVTPAQSRIRGGRDRCACSWIEGRTACHLVYHA